MGANDVIYCQWQVAGGDERQLRSATSWWIVGLFEVGQMTENVLWRNNGQVECISTAGFRLDKSIKSDKVF